MSTLDDGALPERLSGLSRDPHADVLIVGGGINGISAFRELALQGVNVVLVEKNDYCSGASAASSHMIHGGIRYLENGEIRLVRESLLERNRLLETAPHFVKPLKTTIPIFSLFSGVLSAPLRLVLHRGGKPRERGALLIKLGLLIYDLFGRNAGQLPRHEFFGRKKSLAVLPALNADVKFTAHYFDAAIENPERLALDLLDDALAQGKHARAANYVEATSVTGDSIVLVDRISGETMKLQAPVIINASGPWTDLTNHGFGLTSAYMGGTKGSHVVLDNPELYEACGGREIFFENDDGRIVLMYPLLGRVLIGTTDIPIDNPEDAVCTEEEVDYFFDLASHVFPAIALDRSQIVFRYSGVRPLPAAGDLSPGVVSRDYRIVDDTLASGHQVLSLIGGKWTTFRALGEHLADEALKKLPATRTVSSIGLAIGGGKDFPTTEIQRTQWVESHRGELSHERVNELLTRYGTVAQRIMDDIAAHGDTPLTHTPSYSVGEITSLALREHVVTLSDVLHRRTLLGFTGRMSTESVKEIAGIVGAVLGWSTPEKKKQISAIVLERSLHHES
jgi:glycerol-3-phosphate dehydrogenase